MCASGTHSFIQSSVTTKFFISNSFYYLRNHQAIDIRLLTTVCLWYACSIYSWRKRIIRLERLAARVDKIMTAYIPVNVIVGRQLIINQYVTDNNDLQQLLLLYISRGSS